MSAARTTIEVLAGFSATTRLHDMPTEVVEDSKRVLLDSLGCALVGLDVPKGDIGVSVGRSMGGPSGEATIFGTDHRTSAYGAAFANAETINALDLDTVLPPGHVSPYVLPGLLALAEEGRGASGADVLRAIAVSHEISHRFGRAMDYLRTPKDGGMELPDVLGFTATVFGGAAGAAIVLGQDSATTAHALGIAAAITPVNSYRPWIDHLPNSTIKYSMPGPVTTASLTAAHSAQFGHTGDLAVLDDAELGYPRYIGTKRWEPGALTDRLGEHWGFPAAHSYKPYPHCRVGHAPLDALTSIVRDNALDVAEIDAIRCWGEGWVERPVWLNTEVVHPHEAQFSIAHGLAVGAHLLPPGPQWQQPETINSPSVRALMAKVTFAPHPDYVATLSADPAARPTRVEVDARGETFVAERRYPKGSPSPDPDTYFTTAELVAKFRANAAGRIGDPAIDALVEGILDLENVTDVRALLRLAGTR